MSPTEQAAFRAGIETARQMALVATIAIEARDDARELRQQSAIAALQGLAEGLRAFAVEHPSSQIYCSPADLNSEPTANFGRRVES